MEQVLFCMLWYFPAQGMLDLKTFVFRKHVLT